MLLCTTYQRAISFCQMISWLFSACLLGHSYLKVSRFCLLGLVIGNPKAAALFAVRPSMLVITTVTTGLLPLYWKFCLRVSSWCFLAMCLDVINKQILEICLGKQNLQVSFGITSFLSLMGMWSIFEIMQRSTWWVKPLVQCFSTCRMVRKRKCSLPEIPSCAY